MKKTITIAAYNRPAHLKRLINSLARQVTPLHDYFLVVTVDAGGDKFDEVLQVANSINFVNKAVIAQKENVGINQNTYDSIHVAFEGMSSQYNLYLEDDLILAPDALALVDWYIDKEPSFHDISALCLCNLRSESEDPAQLFRSRRFAAWGFAMSYQRWRQVAEPVWLKGERMWDNRVANYIRTRPNSLHNIFPEVSRAKNIGVDGSHLTKEKLEELTKVFRFQNKRRTYEYYLE